MSTAVTFFRGRGTPGETYRVDVTTQQVVKRFHVFSRRPLDVRKFQDRPAKEVNRDLESTLGEKGGIFAVIAEDLDAQGTRRTLRVNPCAASGEPTIQSVAILRPGYPLESRAVSKDKDISLAPGSHVIVPVDGAAEEQLAAFRQNLDFLSADLEALVLNAIRKPSLDARLERLEARVFPKESAQGTAAPAGGWLRGRLRSLRGGRGRLVAAVTALLLLAALVLLFVAKRSGWWQSWRGAQDVGTAGDDQDGDKHSGGPAASEKPTGAPTTGPTEPAAIATSLDPWNDLFAALRSEKDAHPDSGVLTPRQQYLRTLYDSHFSTFEGALSAGRIAQSVEALPANRPLLWGLIKLEALRLHQGAVDPSFLEKADKWTATKLVFTQLDGAAIEQPDARDLLAFLACRLAFENPPSPVLPATNGSPSFRFSESECGEFTLEKANPEIARLLDFVNSVNVDG